MEPRQAAQTAAAAGCGCKKCGGMRQLCVELVPSCVLCIENITVQRGLQAVGVDDVVHRTASPLVLTCSEG